MPENGRSFNFKTSGNHISLLQLTDSKSKQLTQLAEGSVQLRRTRSDIMYKEGSTATVRTMIISIHIRNVELHSQMCCIIMLLRFKQKALFSYIQSILYLNHYNILIKYIFLFYF